METANRVAVVWATRGVNDTCELARIRHLVQTSGGRDVWIMHSDPNNEILLRELIALNGTISPTTLLPQRLFLQPQINSTYDKFNGNSGSAKPAFLDLLSNHMHTYDFGWLLENDAFYAGPWTEFFDGEDEDTHIDFLTAKLFWHAHGNWNWLKWKMCKIKGRDCRLFETLQHGWMVSRISSRFAKSLWQDVQDGTVHGHHEAVVAPYCRLNNFTTRKIDMTTVGSYFFSGHIGNNTDDEANGKVLDEVPSVSKSTLIHPIKCNAYITRNRDIDQDIQRWASQNPRTKQEIWESRNIPQTDMYWIHGRKIVAENDYWMQSQFQRLGPARPRERAFAAVSKKDIHDMIQDKKLVLSVSDPTVSEKKFYSDVARLVSHIQAIQTAYQEGLEEVLIVENDVYLQQHFFRDQRRLASWAPRDWKVLQWTLDSYPSLKQTAAYSDPWISWTSSCMGMEAYTIKRAGMESLLRAVAIDGDEKTPLVLDSGLSVAEIVGHTYTSTNNIIPSNRGRKALNTTIFFDFHSSFTNYEERMLVIQSLPLEDEQDAALKIPQLELDIESLCKQHGSKCDWIIKPIVKPNTAWQKVRKFLRKLPKNAQILDPAFQDSFDWIVELKGVISDYDFVLLKDFNQRIAGFPWSGFFSRVISEKPRVASALYEETNGPSNSTDGFHSAISWKEQGQWSSELFAAAQPVPVLHVESFFSLVDAQFFKWLLDKISASGGSVGRKLVEKSWCAASKEFGGRKRHCLLIPLVSIRDVTNSTGRATSEDKSRDPSQELSGWSEKSATYIQFVNHTMTEILELCRRALRMPKPFATSLWMKKNFFRCARTVGELSPTELKTIMDSPSIPAKTVVRKRKAPAPVATSNALTPPATRAHYLLNLRFDKKADYLPNLQYCKWQHQGFNTSLCPYDLRQAPNASTTDDSHVDFLQINIKCNSFKLASPTANAYFLEALYTLRLNLGFATSSRPMHLLLVCVDVRHRSKDRILPWLMGFFNSSDTNAVLTNHWSPRGLRNTDCPEKLGTSSTASWMLPFLRRDFRRLAVALVGVPKEMAHPAKYFIKSLPSSYQTSFPESPLLNGQSIDETMIHFPCADLLGDPSTPIRFFPATPIRFFKFDAYTQHIDPKTKSIGILSAPLTFLQTNSSSSAQVEAAEFLLPLCNEILIGFEKHLQASFPSAQVKVRLSESEALDLSKCFHDSLMPCLSGCCLSLLLYTIIGMLVMATKGALASPDSTISGK